MGNFMSFFTKKKTEVGTNSDKGKKSSGNPYLDSRQEWLERYGDYIARAAQWRAVAFTCLVIALISITGNVIQASQYKVVPYLVEVDRLGNTRAAVRADRASIAPQKIIQAELANFIRDWRTVTADIDLQQKMIDRLSFFAAGSSKGVLRDYYGRNNPYELAKKGKLVAVEIKGLPLSVSSDSYRVEWTEITRSHTGVELDRQTYEATLAVQINPPTSDAVIVKNPAGVYVTALSMSKVLSPAGSQARQAITTTPTNASQAPAQ